MLGIFALPCVPAAREPDFFLCCYWACLLLFINLPSSICLVIRERERETWERNIWLITSHTHRDRELNPQPFGVWRMLPPTEPPGQGPSTFLILSMRDPAGTSWGFCLFLRFYVLWQYSSHSILNECEVYGTVTWRLYPYAEISTRSLVTIAVTFHTKSL